MKEVHNKIDDMFKSALEEYSLEPSANHFKKLNKKMLFRDLIRFNFRNLFSKSIIRYASLFMIFVSALIVAIFFYENNNDNNNNNTLNHLNLKYTYPNNHSASNNLIKVNTTTDSIVESKLNDKQNTKSNKQNDLYTSLNNALNSNSIDNESESKKLKLNSYKTDYKNKSKKTNAGNSLNNGTSLNNNDYQNKKTPFIYQNENTKVIKGIQNNYKIEDYKNMFFEISKIQPKPAYIIKIAGGENDNSVILIKNESNKFIKNSPKKPNYLFPKYTIELYGGADYVNKILSSSLSDYIVERKNSEKSILAYNIGADIKYTLKNTFVQAGVSKTTFGENVVFASVTKLLDSSASHFNYQYHQIIRIDTIGWTPIWDSIHIIDSIPILDSVIFNKVDSSWVSVYDSINKENNYEIKNRINYIEIPVLIGFNFGNSPLRFNVATGVSFGFLTNSRGKLIRPFTNDISDFNKTYFPFNKIIYNYILRAGCYYFVNEKWSIFMRGSFKYNINSIFDKSYPIHQKYYTIGLQGGISFNL